MVPASTKIEGEYLLQRYFPPAADVRGLKLLHVFQQIMTIVFSSFIFRAEIHRSSYICSHLRDPLPPRSSAHPDKTHRKQPRIPFGEKKTLGGCKAQVKPGEAAAFREGRKLKISRVYPRLSVFHRAEQSTSLNFRAVSTFKNYEEKRTENTSIRSFHLAPANSVYGRDIHVGNRESVRPWMRRERLPRQGWKNGGAGLKPGTTKGRGHAGTQIPGRQNPARPWADVKLGEPGSCLLSLIGG